MKLLFLHKLPHLEQLKLIEWPLYGVVSAAEALTPNDEDFRRHEINSLPHLNILILSVFNRDFESTDDSFDDRRVACRVRKATKLAEACLKMLKKRRAGQLVPFYLDLPDLRYDMHYGWPTKLSNKFRQATRGTLIEVRRGSEVIDWMP